MRRMDHLSPGCNDVLAVASAIGREFDLAVLQRVSGIPAHRVSAALEEAVAARVLVELPAAIAPGGSYRFNHTLLRETISGGLAPRRRRRLHGRIAEALEELYGDDLDAHLAELAHHYEAAGRGRAGTRGIDYAARAGERAGYQPVRSVLLPECVGDPVALIRAFRQRLGAERCYVADLNAIAGGAVQRRTLRRLSGRLVP